jgi:hypothetical protein
LEANFLNVTSLTHLVLRLQISGSRATRPQASLANNFYIRTNNFILIDVTDILHIAHRVRLNKTHVSTDTGCICLNRWQGERKHLLWWASELSWRQFFCYGSPEILPLLSPPEDRGRTSLFIVIGFQPEHIYIFQNIIHILYNAIVTIP